MRTGMRDLSTLPKANIHVHLENAVRPATLRELANRHAIALPDRLSGDRCVVAGFGDFFVQNAAVRACIIEVEDFRRVAYEFCEDEAAQGVRYAEVTFTAAAHGERTGSWDGPLAAVVDGLDAGRDTFGIECRLILDHSRRRPVERAWRTLELALDHRDVVVALGLSGDDAHPAKPFRDVFDAAKTAGLGSVPHAGESAGPGCIREALSLLHADRIGHGISATGDPALLSELRDAAVPLEICPSSNVALGLVPSLEAHPLLRLLEAGLTVTLNTDIPSMTGVSITAEFENARAAFGLDDRVLAALAIAGVDASFAPAQLKQSLRQEINDWLLEPLGQS
jgi:adenosine deaminase